MAEPQRKVTRPFGEPLDLDILLEFAVIDEEDVPDALDWWDKNASQDWVGALNNEPIGKKK